MRTLISEGFGFL